jgi:hypothetical protein
MPAPLPFFSATMGNIIAPYMKDKRVIAIPISVSASMTTSKIAAAISIPAPKAVRLKSAFLRISFSL